MELNIKGEKTMTENTLPNNQNKKSIFFSKDNVNLSEEMEALKKIGLNYVIRKAKVADLNKLTHAYRKFEDDTVFILESLLETEKEEMEKEFKILKIKTKVLILPETKDDFIEMAKKTKFNTHIKDMDFITLTSMRPEVVSQVEAIVYEEILKSNAEEIAKLIQDNQDGKVQRFVSHYGKKGNNTEIETWLLNNMKDRISYSIAIDGLHEMKKRSINIQKQVAVTVNRWIKMMPEDIDRMSEVEVKELYEKYQKVILEMLKKEIRII
jgi:hypothetical protein